MKRFLLSVAFLALVSQLVHAQNPFRTRQTGNWNDFNTWEEDAGGGFLPTLNTPTSTSGAITILNAHIVTITANVLIDETIIQSGGSVVVNSGFTLSLDENFSSNPLTIDSGGSLTNNGTLDLATFLIISPCVVNGNITNSNTISIADGSLLQFNTGSSYFHNFSSGGTVPSATWDANSTCEINNLTAASPTPPSNLNQPFGNFRWNTPAMGTTTTFSLGGQLTSISGNLVFVSSNTKAIRFNRAGSGYTLNITGNFDNQGAPLILADNLSSAVIVNVGGTYTQSQPAASVPSFIFFASSNAFDATINITGGFTRTAGTISRGTASSSSILSTFNFNGSSTQTYSYSNPGVIGTQINYSVASGATLDVGISSLTGTGTFTLNGTLRVGSTDAGGAIQTGTTNGNIRVSGTRTYASGSTIIYNGSAAQFIGSGHPSVSNTQINNSNGVTLASDVTVNGNLTLTTGNLNIAGNTLTIGGGFTPNSNLLGINSSSSLVINGSGVLGNLPLSGGPTINNFTLNRSAGSVTLSSNLSIAGTLTQTAGDINLNGNTLTVSGPYSRVGGNFAGTSTSSLIITGAGSLPGSIGISGSALNTFTMSRGSSTLVSSSAFTVSNLNILSGTFQNDGTITMASGGAILTRDVGTITGSGTITAVSTYDVTYTNSGGSPITTGSELPVNTTQLRNLTINSSGQVNLNAAVTVNGILTFTSGTFNAGANSMDLKGNLVSNNPSTLTSSSITFSGTTTLSGIQQVIFGNVTVTGTLTPTSALAINGNLVNNGTLNSGSSTVTFGGSTAITGSSISSFNNVIVSASSSLTAPSTSMNVAGTWTNNGTFTNNNGTVVFNGTSTIGGTSTTNFGGITIAALSTLTSPANLFVSRNFTNNGTFNAGTGNLTFNGSVLQTLGGTANTTFYDITASNSVTISSAQNISGVLSINSGTFTTGNVLTLLSTASGDAMIGPVGGTLSGNIIVQRYLQNGTSVRTYRYLASPVVGATVADWKISFPITGTFTDPSTQAEWPAISGIVQASPSMYFYNEPLGGAFTARYATYPLNGNSTSASSLVNGTGYAAYVRQTVPITLSLTGSVRTGNNVTVPVTNLAGDATDDGWNLIGNPFPAPINWSSVNLPAGLNNAIHLKDNTGNLTTAGSYVTYIGGVGNPGSYTGVIPSGEAFFVRYTTIGTTNIVFKEADKITSRNPTFLRSEAIVNILRAKLKVNGRQDELVIRLVDGAKDEIDNKFDAYKLTNDYLNFSSLSSDGKKLSINGAASLGTKSPLKKFPLVIAGNGAFQPSGNATISFSEIETFASGVDIYLKDAFLGDSVKVESQSSIYSFNITSDPKSYQDRFTLSIGRANVVTSLQDEAPDNLISVYPNPSEGVFTIQLSKKFERTVKAINSIGKEVGQLELTSEGDLLSGQFDLTSQSSGLYFIQISDGNKLYTKKVIKK